MASFVGDAMWRAPTLIAVAISGALLAVGFLASGSRCGAGHGPERASYRE